MQAPAPLSARPATPPSPSPQPRHPQPSLPLLAIATPERDRDDVPDDAARPPSTPGGSVPSPLSLTMSLSSHSVSLGLHQLGIPMASPLLPLHRQFSMSTQDEADEVDDEDSGVSSIEGSLGTPDSPGKSQDSRDVLVDRLNDLVRHLTAQDGQRPAYDDEVLSTLHARVNEMEAVLSVAGQGHQHRHRRRSSRQRPRGSLRQRAEADRRAEEADKPADKSADASADTSADKSMDLTGLPEPLPDPSNESADQPQHPGELNLDDTEDQPPAKAEGQQGPQETQPQPQPETPPQPEPQPPPPTVPKEVTIACEELSNDLANVLSSLTTRGEELEHIQNILLSQLVAATDRADELAAEVAFLRLQLRAIEVQCRAYMPAEADPELAASIENWKADWAALQKKVTQERMQEQPQQQTLEKGSLWCSARNGWQQPPPPPQQMTEARN